MKVLLLGGTGVIGSYLIDMFHKDNVETYVTSRSKHKSYGTIHYIHGNAKDSEFLKTICKDSSWDAIVDFMSYKTLEFESRLDMLLASTKQYIFISTARVYGNEEHPIKESSPRLLDCSKDSIFLNTDEYSLTKARQENLLINSSKNNYTIVRPCITYGVERMQLGVMEKEEWLYRAIHGRTVVFCNEIMDKITTMTIGLDICKALYAVIGNFSSIGKTYHLTNAHHRTWQEIFNIYNKEFKKLTGKNIKLKTVSLNDFLNCRSDGLKYQVIYDRVYDRDYNTDLERTLVNVDNFAIPEDGLSNCIRNFIVQNHNFKSINWKYEARKDKLTKENTPLTEIKGFRNKINYIFERYLKQ